MERMSDEMLLDELKRRFEENTRAINDLRIVTRKLEALNERLRQSEALKSNFLSNIRNEINNPLTAIMGSAQQIVSGKGDAKTARMFAEIIYTEAFDLDFQLQNIFVAAELEAGESSLSVARVDVAELIRDLLASFRQKAAARQLAMKFEGVSSGKPDGELPFTTDPDKLRKVLMNLLANAIEFNVEGKAVLVRAWREMSRLHLSISDEGIGIPASEQNKIFDRFVQLDSGSQKRHKGQGLGLSIVKDLVELLDGTIMLTSQVGAGSVFSVTLNEQGAGRDVDMSSDGGNDFIFENGKQY